VGSRLSLLQFRYLKWFSESVKIELPTQAAKSKSSGLFWFRTAMLLLCVSVFAWGLHYKLSLYHTARPAHPTMVAKLMRGEQKSWATSSSSDLIRPTPSHFPAGWIIPIFRSPLPIQRHRPVDSAVVPLMLTRPMQVPFFRPPPQSL
jgi:hypothetical protein